MPPTAGSLHVFRRFPGLKLDAVNAAVSRPAHLQVTQTVGQPILYDGVAL